MRVSAHCRLGQLGVQVWSRSSSHAAAHRGAAKTFRIIMTRCYGEGAVTQRSSLPRAGHYVFSEIGRLPVAASLGPVVRLLPFPVPIRQAIGPPVFKIISNALGELGFIKLNVLFREHGTGHERDRASPLRRPAHCAVHLLFK